MNKESLEVMKKV